MEGILKYKNAIIALVIIVAFAWVLNNLNSYYILKQEELEAIQLELENGKRTIEQWDKLQRDFDQLGKDFFVKDTLLVKRFVEESGRTNQVEIVNLNVSNADKDFYWEASMKVIVICHYNDFVKFIKSLEGKKISVNAARIGRIEDKIRAEVNLNGVVLK